MTQQNLRGAYYRPEHDRKEDWDWLAKWQPNVIRLMVEGKPDSPDSVSVAQIQKVHDTCPEATILLRCWEIDDNNFKAHDAMVADPQGTAQTQLDWWAGLFDRLTGIPRTQLMAGLNNETGPDKDSALYPYTERALEIGTARGVQLGVWVFSVGRPSLPGEAVWTIDSFARLDDAIVANKGARLLHEYFQPEGMYAVWIDDEGKERKDYTYLVGRHTRWTGKSKIIIAEWGLNGLLYNRHPDPRWGDSGWLNFKKEWPPSRYADEYVECVRVASDNVIAICPYIEDWSDHHWQSFDLIEAYEEFLARKDLCVKDVGAPTAPTTPPITIHLPEIHGPAPTGPTATPWTSAGSRIRSGPGKTYPVIANMATGVPMAITGRNADSTWWQVAHPLFGTGWVSETVVSLAEADGVPVVEVDAQPEQPQPTPSQPTLAPIEPRVAQAILAVESGGNAFGPDGRPLIRFEAHIFKQQFQNDERFDQFFRFNPDKPWTEQERRITINHPWKPIHTGNQQDENDAFAEAQMMDVEAAHNSISMGAGQIMGFNHARIGYPTAQAMYQAFKSAPLQTIGFINFVLADPDLAAAMRNKDWRTVAAKYNGTGNVDQYSKLLQQAYANLGAA